MAQQTRTNHRRTRLSPDDRRAQILDVTVDLIRASTLDKVDAALIGEAAGVSRSLVFHYFPSTRELHLAVLDIITSEMLGHIDCAVATKPVNNDESGIVSGVRAFIEFVARQPSTFTRMASLASHDPEFGQAFDRVREFGIELLRSGQLDNSLTDLQADLLHGWVAMVETVTVEWIEEPSTPIEEVVHALASVAARILGRGE